jgi:ferredoxin
MELAVDADRCQGHGRCYDLAPELFDADEEGHAVLLTPGGQVGAEAEAAAARAVRSCPEQALSLEA